MKILVIGAGVLGSLYAARLKEVGYDVTLLARPQRAEEIRKHGVVLVEQQSGQRTSTAVPVIEQLAADARFDWALVLVRKNQVADVLPCLAANELIPNVLFLTNNAAGPAGLTAVLGRKRVLLGFPGAGGGRSGHVVQYQLVKGLQPTTLGELNGAVTPRLQEIAFALRQAGFPVVFSKDMDAWLKTHAMLVAPIANAIYASGGDVRRLAATPDAVVLMVRAMQEGLSVLRQLGVPVLPWGYRLLPLIPEPLLVAILCRSLNSERAELVMQRHANAARDEMSQITDEVIALAAAAGTPTPAIDCLVEYLDQRKESMHPGCQKIKLRWDGVWVWLAVITGILLFFWPRRQKCECRGCSSCSKHSSR